jgi:hypothetical protein
VQSESEGIKLKPEKMVADKLYHCIHEGKVFLFYKDGQEILHCYEVEDISVQKEILENPSCIEEILRKLASSD